MEKGSEVVNLSMHRLDIGYQIRYSISKEAPSFGIRSVYDQPEMEYKEEAYSEVGEAVSRFKELDKLCCDEKS